jgi:hypothetical protein
MNEKKTSIDKQQNSPDWKKTIRQSISIATMAAVASTVSGDFKKGFRMNTAEAATTTMMTDTETAELAEVAKAIVSFETPVIESTLPENVIVKQNFTVNFAESGQVSGGIEIFTNGVWQELCPSIPLGGVYPGQTGMGDISTEPGDITSSGLYKFVLSFLPDGGGPEQVFDGGEKNFFEIVDPNAVVEPEPVCPVDLPSYSPVTRILDLPSVEVVGDTTYEGVKVWLKSDGTYEITLSAD